MSVTLFFLISFVAAPTIFWLLARQRLAHGYFTLLCVMAVTLMVAAYAISRLTSIDGNTSVYLALTPIILLWLGWIAVVSLCALALRKRLPAGPAQQWSFAIGAMATTLPWFGLYAAQIIAD